MGDITDRDKEDKQMKSPPGESEQNLVRAYCLHRPLYRPKTNIRMTLLRLLAFESSVILVSLILFLILIHYGGAFFSLMEERELFLLIYNGVTILFLILFLKRIFITTIELYQHYAPEETRRKCLLMPTCSEYALLALQKYGVIKGMYKIYVRITKKCKGNTYYIDYP